MTNMLKKSFSVAAGKRDGVPRKAPSPEEFITNYPYAISLSPSDEYALTEFDETSIENWISTMKAVFVRVKSTMQLKLEYSSSGRLHFHGFIQAKSVNTLYLHDLPLLHKYFSYEVDTIGDLQTWGIYCNKSYRHMRMLESDFTIPRNWSNYIEPPAPKVKLGGKVKLNN